MRVLIVCSKNSGKIAPFVVEQVDSLNKLGVITDYFTIQQKGWRGYLRSRKSLIEKIETFRPNLIHAHFGLSGLLANLQRRVPVVTTYHGSDINNDKVFRFSKLAIRLSRHNIFVSQKNIDKANVSKNFSLIPCGVETEVFSPKDKIECRKELNLDLKKKYVLFAGAFENKVKNAELAKKTIRLLDDKQVELLELKGYNRGEVVLLMNAADCCLMTSYTEGSPQFIKEAMSCNCPIVTVDVGDVTEMIGKTEGCYICKSYEEEIKDNLQKALQFDRRTRGRLLLVEKELELEVVAARIVRVYKEILT